jgi:16S rRNA processing protein RimM
VRGDPRVEIGRIARAHGIRGEVVIATHDPGSDLLDRQSTLWIGGVAREVVQARSTPRGWLVQLADVATRNAAEALRGQVVEVDRAAPWGTIAAVESGMQDRLVIHDGDIERQLPLVDEFVTAIDVEAGVVTVDPPDGLPEHKR